MSRRAGAAPGSALPRARPQSSPGAAPGARLAPPLRPFAAAPLRLATLVLGPAVAAAAAALATVVAARGTLGVAGWGLRPAPVPADGGAFGWTRFARSADAVQAEGLAGLLGLILGVVAAGAAAALVVTLAGWAQHGLAARRGSAVRRALGESPRAARATSVRVAAVVTFAAGLLGGAFGGAAALALAALKPEALVRSGAPPSLVLAAGVATAAACLAAIAGLLPTVPRDRAVGAILAVGGRATEDPAVGFVRRAVASVQVAALVFGAGTILVLAGSALLPDRDPFAALGAGDTVIARVTVEGAGADDLSTLHRALAPALLRATGARAASTSSPGTLAGLAPRDYVATYCGFCVIGGLGVDMISVDARLVAVGPGFFAAHGMPVLDGRTFTPGDRVGAPAVALVSASYARRFDDGQPVGKRIMTGGAEPAWATIVGVVPDLPEGGFAAAGDPPASAYLPAAQSLPTSFDVALRSAPSSADVRGAVRAAVAAALPEGARVRVGEPRALEAMLGEAEAPLRWLAALLAAAALPALLLAVVGMASGMAEDARARARELGIRSALGATPARLARSIVLRGLAVGLRGLVAGLVLFLAADIALRDRLPTAHGAGVGTYAALALLVVGVSIVATARPALRTARSEPARGLTGRPS